MSFAQDKILANKEDAGHSYVTGTGAISSTLNPGYAFQLEAIYLHLSAAGGAAENFSVKVDSAQGSAYDVNLVKEDMTTNQDILYQPYRPLFLKSGDKINSTYVNTNTRTYGLEYVYRKVLYDGLST